MQISNLISITKQIISTPWEQNANENIIQVHIPMHALQKGEQLQVPDSLHNYKKINK